MCTAEKIHGFTLDVDDLVRKHAVNYFRGGRDEGRSVRKACEYVIATARDFGYDVKVADDERRSIKKWLVHSRGAMPYRGDFDFWRASGYVVKKGEKARGKDPMTGKSVFYWDQVTVKHGCGVSYSSFDLHIISRDYENNKYDQVATEQYLDVFGKPY